MRPRPLVYALTTPWMPRICPAVGKSGPGTSLIRSAIVTFGSLTSARHASMTSPKLCGGMFVAMPTAMPDEPFTSKFGMRVGSTDGSRSLSS